MFNPILVGPLAGYAGIWWMCALISKILWLLSGLLLELIILKLKVQKKSHIGLDQGHGGTCLWGPFSVPSWVNRCYSAFLMWLKEINSSWLSAGTSPSSHFPFAFWKLELHLGNINQIPKVVFFWNPFCCPGTSLQFKKLTYQDGWRRLPRP